MKIEPKPAVQATLYLVAFIVLLVLLPWKVLAPLLLLYLLGMLWWLMYTSFRDQDRLKKELELHRLKKQGATLTSESHISSYSHNTTERQHRLFDS